MSIRMNMSFRRLALLTGCTLILAGCGNKKTKEALQQAATLESINHHSDANSVLVAALRAREQEIRSHERPATTQTEEDALVKKVQADSEILKMERAQVPIYLRQQRADLASAVEEDILKGNPGDPLIVNLLQDKDPALRLGAARVLGLIAQPDGIDPLTRASKDSDHDVRRAAVAALGSIKDPKTVAPLLDALKDSYWFVRSDAAEALGRQHDPRAIDPLLDAVKDSDSTVESSAENAVVIIVSSAKPAPDVFVNRLNDPNEKVATICAVSLVILKDPRAVPVLIKLSASSDLQIRLHAVKALGETGDSSALPTLRLLLKDADPNMRGWSIISLGKLKDQSSVPQLQAMAANEQELPEVRKAANMAVQYITTPAPTAAQANP